MSRRHRVSECRCLTAASARSLRSVCNPHSRSRFSTSNVPSLSSELLTVPGTAFPRASSRLCSNCWGRDGWWRVTRRVVYIIRPTLCNRRRRTASGGVHYATKSSRGGTRERTPNRVPLCNGRPLLPPPPPLLQHSRSKEGCREIT